MRTTVWAILTAATLAADLVGAQQSSTAAQSPAAQGGRGQGGRGGRGQSPATPQADMIFRAQNALGVLRGLNQIDSINRIEYWATGTVMIDGRSYKVSNYRASINYAMTGMRVDMTREGGTPARVVQVVGGGFAWNETEPGKNATPMPSAATERLVQLWSTPMGALKAAAAAGGKLQLTTEGGVNVLAFPLPAPLSEATMKVTLSNQEITMANGQKRRINNLVERVEARVGNTVAETIYAEYGDWNDKDAKADVLLPRRITQKQGTVTVLDLTVERTNTYNPYVITPVPENVERAR